MNMDQKHFTENDAVISAHFAEDQRLPRECREALGEAQYWSVGRVLEGAELERFCEAMNTALPLVAPSPQLLDVIAPRAARLPVGETYVHEDREGVYKLTNYGQGELSLQWEPPARIQN